MTSGMVGRGRGLPREDGFLIKEDDMAGSKDASGGGMQDTGNPVLDSMVNIACSDLLSAENMDALPQLHKILLELAGKEPGGLKARSGDGWLEPRLQAEAKDCPT